MYRLGQDGFQRHWGAQARKRLLAAGLSLTLVGADHGAPASAGELEVSAAHEPSPVPVIQRAADASTPPPSGGALLTGTILTSKSADARIIITDRRGRQRVYARGDEIADGGEVVEIHRDFVVVLRGGHLETLEFSWNAATRKVERAPSGAEQKTPTGDYRHEVFSHPELLLQLVGASVVIDDGHFRGYRVMQPEDPTFIESLGLKPGDILTAVNGVPLDTPDYGAQVLDAVSGAGDLSFTVQRGSQILVVSE